MADGTPAVRPVTGIQYTLRNVPPALDRTLRRRARQLSKSLNQVALEALDFLFGSWVEDPVVDQAFAGQRKIDADRRRQACVSCLGVGIPQCGISTTYLATTFAFLNGH